MPLTEGEPAPWFKAPTASNPEFVFDTVAGRYILLAFLPTETQACAAALKALAAHQALFDGPRLAAFGVVRDPQLGAGLQDLRALKWFLDYEGELFKTFGLIDEAGDIVPMWMILDPTLRLWKCGSMAQTDQVFHILKTLPAPSDYAGVPLHAPVLIAPRVFEPDLCADLIALHEATGGEFTGVMRDVGVRTVMVMDELKKRRDILVTDPALQAQLRERLEQRLFPMIERFLGFRVTRIERYVISCYDAADGGVFHAHRDNVTFGQAHRKFACSLNLNADFLGGDLRFPEFGAQTYRPPLGGAVVFSCGLLHEATRMTAGRRYAFLPFFHDEAGQAVLEAYHRGASEKG